MTYQINVAYDKDLFEAPPTIEAGPEAWKPKIEKNNRKEETFIPAPRLTFVATEDQIRKGLPEPGPFGWRDLRICA